jgi:hypothetical protein
LQKKNRLKLTRRKQRLMLKKMLPKNLLQNALLPLKRLNLLLEKPKEPLNVLKKNHIGEMKAFTSPPPGVVVTSRVVLALT